MFSVRQVTSASCGSFASCSLVSTATTENTNHTKRLTQTHKDRVSPVIVSSDRFSLHLPDVRWSWTQARLPCCVAPPVTVLDLSPILLCFWIINNLWFHCYLVSRLLICVCASPTFLTSHLVKLCFRVCTSHCFSVRFVPCFLFYFDNLVCYVCVFSFASPDFVWFLPALLLCLIRSLPLCVLSPLSVWIICVSPAAFLRVPGFMVCVSCLWLSGF